MTDALPLSYHVSFWVLTAIIVVTFLTTCVFLFSEARGAPPVRRFSKMLNEKSPTPSPQDTTAQDGEVVSYSRVAGVLGAMSVTGLFICVVYWVHHALYTGQNLEALTKLTPPFLIGSALFVPYAFNRLSQIGK